MSQCEKEGGVFEESGAPKGSVLAGVFNINNNDMPDCREEFESVIIVVSA